MSEAVPPIMSQSWLWGNQIAVKKKKNYKPITENNFWNHNYIKYGGGRNKKLSVKEYWEKSKPYSRDIINRQKSDTWKIQIIVAINFISCKDVDEECTVSTSSLSAEGTTLSPKFWKGEDQKKMSAWGS